jgi:translocation and assembly module TamA
VIPRVLRIGLLTVLMAVATSLPAQTTEVTVVIEGLDADLKRNVEQLLGVARQKTVDEERLRALHERAPDEIRRALEPFGYYRARIGSELTREDKGWVARYTIDPGVPMRVGKVEIVVIGEGASDTAFQELIANPPLRQDAILRHPEYERTRNMLQSTATERGYFDARLLRHELRIDLAAYSASVFLHIDTGSRYRFGDVTFEQDYFDTDFLRRFSSIEPGQPYSNDELLRLQGALSEAGYFERVEVRPRRDLASDRRVPVDVVLTLRPPNRYTFGIGYGTDTGARGTIGWEKRPFNRSGHRLATEIDVSEIRSAATATYTIPVLDPRTDRVALQAGMARQHTLTSLSELATIGASLHQARGDWRETLSLNYQRERFVTGDDSGNTILLIPSVSWVHTRADSTSRPIRGSRIQLDLLGATDQLVSDISFWQTRVNGRFILPVGSVGRVVTRANAGYTETSQFNRLPPSLRFYAGGAESVRGYRYQDIGPVDDDGDVTGGRYLTVGSVEYEHFVTPSWGVAVFYDIGRAFNDSDEPYREGAGIGARWRLPIGMARLDVAQALSDERSWRVHFSIVVEP